VVLNALDANSGLDPADCVVLTPEIPLFAMTAGKPAHRESLDGCSVHNSDACKNFSFRVEAAVIEGGANALLVAAVRAGKGSALMPVDNLASSLE
jgi:hypothetical protein